MYVTEGVRLSRWLLSYIWKQWQLSVVINVVSTEDLEPIDTRVFSDNVDQYWQHAILSVMVKLSITRETFPYQHWMWPTWLVSNFLGNYLDVKMVYETINKVSPQEVHSLHYSKICTYHSHWSLTTLNRIYKLRFKIVISSIPTIAVLSSPLSQRPRNKCNLWPCISQSLC